MKKNKLNVKLAKLAAGLLVLVAINTGCKKENPPIGAANEGLNKFEQINLVASNASYNALRVDPLLQNAWGIAISPTGNIWLSAEASGYSAVYNKEGVQLLPDVTIPSPTTTTNGQPTGIVFNNTMNFILPNGLPAKFVFAGADGVISGWNQGNLSAAVRVINNSATASYFGLTLASYQGVNYLYAANFKSGTIDVFDKDFNKVNIKFTDPNLPSGFYPYNVQLIDNSIYVTYAKIGDYGSEVLAAGAGIVNIFNTDGSFAKRFVTNGKLNAPWGITKAPSSFFGADSAKYINTILVGNFGNGHINAFSATGTFLGELRKNGEPININGLWGISFAPTSATSIDPNRLYFNAGPSSEKDGLFGYITKKDK